MTAAATGELSRTTTSTPCCRRAEAITVLRFAGGLHQQDGQVRIEVDLPTLAVARRVVATIRDLYGYPTRLHVLPTPGFPAATRRHPPPPATGCERPDKPTRKPWPGAPDW